MASEKRTGLSLAATLRQPVAAVREVDRCALAEMPWGAWTGLVLIAVGGSCTYGASLAVQFPEWSPGAGAAWLALSAGLAWCLLGPALILLTRQKPWTLAHACLVTMAYGEGVLQLAALANVFLLPRGAAWAAAFNYAMVGLSNVVMAAGLTAQLRALGAAPWRTLLAWLVVLNGSGALFFTLFYRLLGGAR